MIRSALVLLLAAVVVSPASAVDQSSATLTIRGRAQSLRIYGDRNGQPIVVTSGDGGWMHLGPHVAETLSRQGFFVVGFDARAYLESFTTSAGTLQPAQEPRDYKVLADFAGRGSTRKPILIGVSEGAGLSVLAATDPDTQKSIAGVIGLGLPDLNELGWRLKDMIIYITRGNPDEPMFSTKAVAAKVSPLPLAAIHATHDEYVPLPEVQQVMAAARAPKQLWIVKASDHRFSDNLAEFDKRLLEAIAWVNQNAPR